MGFPEHRLGGFIFSEQGILLNCFRGEKEILIIVCGGQGITNPLSIIIYLEKIQRRVLTHTLQHSWVLWDT